MSLTVTCQFKKVDPSNEITSLKCKEDTLLVWWYCGIFKNQQDKSQPLVLVAFRKLISDNEFSDEIEYRRISITLLGQIRLGSLCKKNRVIAIADYETKTIEVSNLRKDWSITSFNDAFNKNIKEPFPQTIYPLRYKYDKNHMIKYNLSNGGNLLIPCLEYFSRCYGFSGELRRILVTYPWDGKKGCLDRFFFYSNENENQSDKIWRINIRKKLYNEDSYFLAHVKYDNFTEKAAKIIYSHLETEYEKSNSSPAFPIIEPWFQANATLNVGGIPFNDGLSFLGLQVLGISDPPGNKIIAKRENRGNAKSPAGIDAEGKAWAGISDTKNDLEHSQLIDTEESNTSTISIEVKDPTIFRIGPRRPLEMHSDESANDSKGPPSKGDNAESFSAGEPINNNNQVGRASVIKKSTIESDGVLRDMWNAILHLKKLKPNEIKSVDWYSPKYGFLNNKDPELIPLINFRKGETYKGKKIESAVKKWVYMGKPNASELRGLLVMRICTHHSIIYLIEIQRKLIDRKDDYGKTVIKEESLTGLIFTLDNNDSFEEWFNFLRSNVRFVKGVLQKLIKYCPGNAFYFKHSQSASHQIPCWSALKNALRKLNILI